MPRFVAIDFETANRAPTSACAVGLAVAEGGHLVETHAELLRPPTPVFEHTAIHGIAWRHVCAAPPFAEWWRRWRERLEGVEFLAAHNAGFDRRVLEACCRLGAEPPPARPFVCTVQVAREVWDLRPTKLPDVCRHLGIPLRHHDAGSDAEACARIVLAALAEGWRPPRPKPQPAAPARRRAPRRAP